jgi:hypothetical protein
METRTIETIDEVSKWTVGLGMLTLALAPLSLPFLILTAAALLPLLAVGLVAAVVAAPVLVIRRLRRSAVRRAEERGVRSVAPGRAGSRPARV